MKKTDGEKGRLKHPYSAHQEAINVTFNIRREREKSDGQRACT